MDDVPVLPAAYPGELEETVEVDDLVLVVRPIRPDDGDRLVAFHARLSPRSVHLRFFGAHPRLSPAEVERFTHVDYHDRLALVADDAGVLVAVARYDREPGEDTAEVAFVVADDHQHHGIGTLLLARLAQAAWARGVRTFSAQTLAENVLMQQVFRESGYPVEVVRDHEVLHVGFPIDPALRRSAPAWLPGPTPPAPPAHEAPGC